jgi:hypothetical protein
LETCRKERGVALAEFNDVNSVQVSHCQRGGNSGMNSPCFSSMRDSAITHPFGWARQPCLEFCQFVDR